MLYGLAYHCHSAICFPIALDVVLPLTWFSRDPGGLGLIAFSTGLPAVHVHPGWVQFALVLEILIRSGGCIQVTFLIRYPKRLCHVILIFAGKWDKANLDGQCYNYCLNLERDIFRHEILVFIINVKWNAKSFFWNIRSIDVFENIGLDGQMFNFFSEMQIPYLIINSKKFYRHSCKNVCFTWYSYLQIDTMSWSS